MKIPACHFLPGCFQWESTVFWWTKVWTDRLLCKLDELITRPKDEELPEGKIRVENPELVLTAAYFYATDEKAG